MAAVRAHVREGAGVATRVASFSSRCSGWCGRSAACVCVAFSVAAWPVAHLHALDALEALGIGLGLGQGGLGVRCSLRDFLGGTHLSERSTGAACESDAQMQSSHSRAWQGCSRGCSRLAQLSNGSQGAMVGTGHGGSPHNRTLETRGMLLSLKFGGRVVALHCRHGVSPLYPCTHRHGNSLHELVSAVEAFNSRLHFKHFKQKAQKTTET